MEIKKFEYRGFEGRIEFDAVRPCGTIDGRCLIFERDKQIDCCPLGPMVSHEKEAIDQLTKAGEACMDILADLKSARNQLKYGQS